MRNVVPVEDTTTAAEEAILEGSSVAVMEEEEGVAEAMAAVVVGVDVCMPAYQETGVQVGLGRALYIPRFVPLLRERSVSACLSMVAALYLSWQLNLNWSRSFGPHMLLGLLELSYDSMMLAER